MRRVPGQSALEYTMLVVALAAALLGMGIYVRRAIQANMKLAEQQINQEAMPDVP